jgi:hypothetical protein
MEDFVERRLRALSDHFDQSLVASRPVSFGMSDDDSGTVSWLIKEGGAADQLAEKFRGVRICIFDTSDGATCRRVKYARLVGQGVKVSVVTDQESADLVTEATGS